MDTELLQCMVNEMAKKYGAPKLAYALYVYLAQRPLLDTEVKENDKAADMMFQAANELQLCEARWELNAALKADVAAMESRGLI